jgi:hypothetical protein
MQTAAMTDVRCYSNSGQTVAAPLQQGRNNLGLKSDPNPQFPKGSAVSATVRGLSILGISSQHLLCILEQTF